jgi:hypothetical protein
MTQVEVDATGNADEQETSLYDVDVQEASGTLGVSLARLSQLTTKGTLSHVRKRVGARWRIFYRRDEIMDLARVHRAVVYQRPPHYVPPPLSPFPERKEESRAGARVRGASISELPPDLPSPAVLDVSRFPVVYPSKAQPSSRPTTFGYGSPISSATSLKAESETKGELRNAHVSLKEVNGRLQSLEENFAALMLQVRALRLGVPSLGACSVRPETRSSHLRSSSPNQEAPASAALSMVHPNKVTRPTTRRGKPTRVRFEKSAGT